MKEAMGNDKAFGGEAMFFVRNFNWLPWLHAAKVAGNEIQQTPLP